MRSGFSGYDVAVGLFYKIFGEAPVDESIASQRAIAMENPAVAGFLQAECDELPGATGAFGSVTNPIPVNGPAGEVLYINRLRLPGSCGFMSHRTGPVSSPLSPMPLDRFELLSLNGEVWRVLYFSMYHPRRSTKCPDGLTMARWPKDRDTQIMLKMPSFCSMTPLEDFPYGLPDAIRATMADGFITREMAFAIANMVEQTISRLPSPLMRPDDLDEQ